MENFFGNKLKYLQCDGETKFDNTIFIHLFQELGISLRMPSPYTPQQNGLAEGKHFHIIETAQTLLIQSNILSKYWADVAFTVVFLITSFKEECHVGILSTCGHHDKECLHFDISGPSSQSVSVCVPVV